jgi:uncharacterized membrane protein
VAFVLFVVAVLLLAGGIVMFGSQDEMAAVPQVSEDRALSGGLYTLFGVAFFAMGTVLLFMERGQERREAAAEQEAAARAAKPAAPRTRQVEIKRTVMDVAPAAFQPATVGPDHAALDDVNRKMARLKVQFGMGEVSRESYRHIMETLEHEKSEIELRLLDGRSDD